VEDYWAADLNVNVGHHNFDTSRYEYYRDSDVAFEAFKADAFDFRIENRARNWATGYDIPAVEDGHIIMEEFEEPYRNRGLMVGFIMNSQRPLFEDRNPPGDELCVRLSGAQPGAVFRQLPAV
jgi:microcin C transport system substrate-binding protein